MKSVYACLIVAGLAAGATSAPAQRAGRPFPFRYADTASAAYLSAFRALHRLDDVIASSDSDFERALAITQWAHRRSWHAGVGFAGATREVDYAALARDGLAAVGLPARVVALVPATPPAGGEPEAYTITEAFLLDTEKWVCFDPRAGLAPLLWGFVPLNAQEFAQALRERPGSIVLAAAYGEADEQRRREYLAFAEEHFAALCTAFDQRPGRDAAGGEVGGLRLPLTAELDDGSAGAGGGDGGLRTVSVQAFYPSPGQVF